MKTVRKINSKLSAKHFLARNFLSVAGALFFAVVGTIFLVSSHAATPTANYEAEAGTVSSPASAVADTGASGGNAVKFSTAGTVPAQCASGGAYLWSNLETCGWPGPANTGPVLSDCGGTLTNNSGSLSRTVTISANNSTFSCQNVTGCLYVTGTNVTIRNVKVTCNSGKTGTNANGTAAIFVENGASATIDKTETDGQSGVHACVWHQGASLTVTKLKCHAINDGIFSWGTNGNTNGDNFSISDSYLYDFTAKTANGHIDGYQTEGAANGMIDHNTFHMNELEGTGMDSAIAIWNGNKTSNNITSQNNLIAGGGFAIYAQDYSPSDTNPSGGYSVTNVYFTNNKFSTYLEGNCVGFFGVWFPRGAPTDQWRRSGNKILETGFNLDSGNPSGCN